MYTVVRNSCDCHPETCSHWDYYLMHNGKRMEGGDDFNNLNSTAKLLNSLCADDKVEKEEVSERIQTIDMVSKLLEADSSASIGFCHGEICHLDAIILLTKHQLIG
jgi:hypothetical protein